MSQCYWSIEGVGLKVDDIADRINAESAIKFLIKNCDDDEDLVEDLTDMLSDKTYDAFDIYDYLGSSYSYLAEIFCDLDETGTLMWSHNGEGDSYLYFPRRYPWERPDAEPNSVEGVCKVIIDTVKKLTNMSDAEIKTFIDHELFEVCSG